MSLKFIKPLIVAAGLALGALTISTSTHAQAVATQADYNHHGTECITANLAQGQLFTWNKDGITNNFAIPLFVICPLVFNGDVIQAIINSAATSVNFFIGASAYLPPAVPVNTGIGCFVRFSDPENSPSIPGDPDAQTTVINMPFTVGFKNAAGVGENDTTFSAGFNITSVSNTGTFDLTTAHMLCLLPGGATLKAYDIDFFGL